MKKTKFSNGYEQNLYNEAQNMIARGKINLSRLHIRSSHSGINNKRADEIFEIAKKEYTPLPPPRLNNTPDSFAVAECVKLLRRLNSLKHKEWGDNEHDIEREIICIDRRIENEFTPAEIEAALSLIG